MAFLFPPREPKSRTQPTNPRRSLLILPKPEKAGHQGRISLFLLLVRVPPSLCPSSCSCSSFPSAVVIDRYDAVVGKRFVASAALLAL